MESLNNKRVLHAIDLDRVLFDTETAVRMSEEILERNFPQTAKSISYEMNSSSRRGESYPLYSRISRYLGKGGLLAFEREFSRRAIYQDLLLPDAINRLEHATSRPGWRAGIITYGDQNNQSWKMRMVGLDDEPHLVVQTPEKGRIISSWVLRRSVGPDGAVGLQVPEELGGGIVDTVVLDDDKIEAFTGLPGFCYGNWVNPYEYPRDGQLPPNVERVSGLREAIERTDKLA